MKHFILLTSLLSLSNVGYSQSKQVNWNEVEIFEFQNRDDLPDSLEICGGEWFVKATADNLNELNNREVRRIKKTVAHVGCRMVFIDTQKYYTPRRGKLYILGVSRKK